MQPLVQIGRPRLTAWARTGATHFESLNKLKSDLRARGFCAVPKGNPRIHGMRLDPAAPANAARMAAEMRLRYLVVASVNRDDFAEVRPQADYRQSLDVLRFARRHRPDVVAKPDFMLGMGETANEVEQLLRDVREADVDVATIGQFSGPLVRSPSTADVVNEKVPA